MALGLGSMVKLMRGGMGPDDLAEMLSAAGMECTFDTVPVCADSFRGLGASASLPSSKLVELKGKMKGGGTIHALIAMTQGN